MFRHSSGESVAVEDRCVVVDVTWYDPRPISVVAEVTWYDPHLGVASQRRAICVHLVVRENVEVPDGSAARRITVDCSRGEYLAGVLVDDKRAVVSKLTHQTLLQPLCLNLNTDPSDCTGRASYDPHPDQ